MNKKIIEVRQSIIGSIDIILTVIAYLSAYQIRDEFFYGQYGHLQPLHKYIWLLWLIIPLFPTLFKLLGIYDLRKNILDIFVRTVIAIAVGIMFIVGTFYFMGDSTFSRLFYGIFAITELVFVFGFRVGLKLLYKLRAKTRRAYRRIIIVGNNSLVERFMSHIKSHPEIMIEVVGYVQTDSDESYIDDGCILGKIENLIDVVKKHYVDEVVFALPRNYIPQIESYVLECEEMGITVSMLLDLFDLKIAKTMVGQIGSIPILSFYTVELSDVQLFLKRVIDILGALVGLLITGVVLLFVGPAIWLEDKGPIFFGQNRVGRNGRIFKCYKFRSMYTDAEERKKELMKYNEMKGHMFKIKDDPRITKVGKFIRDTSIDELPQFWNVLKGDMSLVGTRPPTVNEVENYDNYHRRRISIKPGITGMWQVSGRSEIEDFEEIVKLDTWYIDNWSIWLDIKLLFKTVWVVVAGKGAH